MAYAALAGLLLALAATCSRAPTPAAPPAAPPCPDVLPSPAPQVGPGTAAHERDRALSDALFSGAQTLRLRIDLGADARASLQRKRRKPTRVTVRVGQQVLEKVGLRLKGHRTMQKLDEKPSMVLDFDRYAPGRRFMGLRRLVLNNLDDDPTRVREALGYALYRRAGVAAPRTTYAVVTLDGRPRGIYLAVEGVDEVMLARHFEDASGNLYEGEYGCDVRPTDVWGFDMDAGTATGREDLIALAARADAGVAALYTGDKPALDVRRVLAYLATSAVLGDFDGYRHAHNYFLYHEPTTGLWSMIPWGIDRVLFKQLDIFDSDGRLARICLDDRQCRVRYVKAVREAIKPFEGPALAEEVSAAFARVDAIELSDGGRPAISNRTKSKRAALRDFVATRAARVGKQLRCLEGDREVDRDGDGHGCMDCDDGDPAVHPGAHETCNDQDDDCNGRTDDDPACPCAVEEIEGAEFHFCVSEADWATAAADCAARGLTLARIDNLAQSRAVHDRARDEFSGRWWIGLSDQVTESEFRWHDGMPLTWSHWKKGEPNDGYCGEDCVAFAKAGKGRWYDAHCALKRPFICRAPPKAATQGGTK